MSINIPNPLATLPTLGSSTTTLPPVPVIDPPAALSALPTGSVIDATVLNRDPNGVILVRTDQGVFSFNSPLAVRAGASLELTVQGPAGQPQVVPAVVDRGPALPTAPPQAPLPPLTTGSVVDAVLVRPDPSSPPAPARAHSPTPPAARPPAAPLAAPRRAPPPPAPAPPPGPARAAGAQPRPHYGTGPAGALDGFRRGRARTANAARLGAGHDHE